MSNETVLLGGRPVRQMGFGAMQLPGPGVFGPPADRTNALAVLRQAIDAGVNHVDTAQYYGPDVANELIHAALFPYPEELVLVSKVGATRDEGGAWVGAQRPEELRAGVEANLKSLELEQIPVVNLRRHPGSDVSFEEQLDLMQALCDEGLIGAIGLSSVTLEEYEVAQQRIDVACVQNAYNLREQDERPLFDRCETDGVPFVPFFPLGSAFNRETPLLAAPPLRAVAERLGATSSQVALAWLLAQAPTVLLIPGTSSPAHLEENLAATSVDLDESAFETLAELRG
jgi:aryl-alcohol dehydrogenase-like predicted oxidoreductase